MVIEEEKKILGMYNDYEIILYYDNYGPVIKHNTTKYAVPDLFNESKKINTMTLQDAIKIIEYKESRKSECKEVKPN